LIFKWDIALPFFRQDGLYPAVGDWVEEALGRHAFRGQSQGARWHPACGEKEKRDFLFFHI
jgi:hypothetical protein